MVLMKNSAKALAPSAVCWVAATGMTGGFSPLRVFGPVRGTSAGTVGRLGGRVEVRLVLAVDAGPVTGATVLRGGVVVGSGAPDDDDVHATAATAVRQAVRNVVIVALGRTSP